MFTSLQIFKVSYIFVLYFKVVLSTIENFLVGTHFIGQNINTLSLSHHVHAGPIW